MHVQIGGMGFGVVTEDLVVSVTARPRADGTRRVSEFVIRELGFALGFDPDEVIAAGRERGWVGFDNPQRPD